MKSTISRSWIAKIIIAFAAVLAPSAVFGQNAGTPVAIPVRLVAQAVGESGSTMSVAGTGYPMPGNASGYFSFSGTSSTSVLTPFSTTYETVMLEPGKDYIFSVSGTSVQGMQLYAGVQPGYQAEIDGYIRGSELLSENSIGPNGLGDYLAQVHVRIIAPSSTDGASAGTCSSIASGRIQWSVSLGTLKNGSAAGSIVITDPGTETSWSSLFTPALLQYESVSSEVVVVSDSNNNIRQIVSDQALVDVSTPTSTSVKLDFYDPVGMSGGGPYTPSGTPYVSYLISQGSSSTSMQIAKTLYDTAGSVVRTDSTTLTRSGTGPDGYSWDLQDWNLQGQSQLVQEERSDSSDSSGNRVENIAVSSPQGSAVSTSTATYSTLGWGESLVQSVVGGSQAVTTSYQYYGDSSDAASYGFPQSVSSQSGWTYFQYESLSNPGAPVDNVYMGVLSATYQPYGNTPSAIPASPNSSEGIYTTYGFSNDPFGMRTRPTSVVTHVNGVPTSDTETTYPSENQITIKNGTSDSAGTQYFVVTATSTTSTDSGHALTTVRKFFREDTDDDFLRSQTYSIQQADGVQLSYAYQYGSYSNGSFTSAPAAQAQGFPDVRISVIKGLVSSSPTYTSYDGYTIDGLNLVDGKSTLDTTIRDDRGLTVRTESYVWSGGVWQLLNYTNYSYDFAGRLTGTTTSNGLTTSLAYDGDRISSKTDETGTTLSYSYDAAGRVSSITKSNGPTTSYTYDAAGRILTSVTSGSGTSDTLTDTTTYDRSGRPTSQTPAGLGPVNFSYDVTNRTKTTNYPDGSTKVESYNLDGTLASVTGSAVVPTYYSYSVDSSGMAWTKVYSGSSTSPRWQEKEVDWVGRTLHVERPGYSVSGQADYTEDYTYDPTTGRLTESQKTGQAPVLYYYDEFSRLNRSGLDVDRSGSLSLGSTDRITDSNQSVASYNGAWWLETDTIVYPTANSATGTTTSVVRQRLSGFPSGRMSETQTTDVYGNTVVQTVDASPSAATVTKTTTRPDMANSAVETIVNGLPTSAKGFDGLTITRSYDGLERLTGVTDQRGNTTTSSYVSNSTLVSTVKDGAGNPTTFGYDSMGRRTSASDALGNTTYYAYNTRGQLTNSWGAGTNPVQYGYDSTYGDRTTMATYQADAGWTSNTWPASAGSGNVTAWTYDAASGLLQSKTDAAGKAVTFDYLPTGQVHTRTWARGVVTTYTYDPNTAELTGQSYSDGTPSVSYVYARSGQLQSVTDATGTRTFNFDPSQPLRVLNETLDPTFYNSRILTSLYDSNATTASGGTFGSFTVSHLLGRPTGFSLGVSGNTGRDLQQSFTLSNLGQFAGVTTQVYGSAARTFTYAYDSTDMLTGYASGSFGVNYAYEAQRNLRTMVSSAYGSTSITRFDFAYTKLGQKQWAMQSGSAYADYYSGTSYTAVYNYYVYDSKGQLQSTAMYRGNTPPSAGTAPTGSDELPGRRHEYRYDESGNRVSAGQTGSVSSGDDQFVPNALNQYASRENNSVHILGTASPNASVGMLGTSVAKTDRAFAADFVPPNTNGPANGTLSLYSVLPGAGTGGVDIIKTLSFNWFVPPAQQAFTYDADGNMTSDGLWNYTYDAENRLIRMTSTVLAGTGYSWVGIDFTYDYLGRRVEKKLTEQVANSTTYNTILDHKFIYDGWALVAETDASGNLTRGYTWGLDIAGSLDATGGVGALVELTNVNTNGTTSDYFPTYDGNGNVAALVSAGTGNLAAAYEYSPSGQSLRKDVYDSAVSDNPFRFSTKYTDSETGLVYYGHRYYSPSLGRFINRDPIEEAGGLNLYGFCGNDGINRFDLLGNSWLSKLWDHTILSLGKHIAQNWDHGRQYVQMVVAIVASIVTYGAVAGYLYTAATATSAASGALVGAMSASAAEVTAAAAGGFAAGVVSSGIMGDNLRGMLRSGVIGAGIAGVLTAAAQIHWAGQASSAGSDSSYTGADYFRLKDGERVAFIETPPSEIVQLPAVEVSASAAKTSSIMNLIGGKVVLPWTLGNEAHILWQEREQGVSGVFTERYRSPEGTYFGGGRVDMGRSPLAGANEGDLYELKLDNPLQIGLGRAQLEDYSLASEFSSYMGSGVPYGPGDASWMFNGEPTFSLNGEFAAYTYSNAGNGLLVYDYEMKQGYQSIYQLATRTAPGAMPALYRTSEPSGEMVPAFVLP